MAARAKGIPRIGTVTRTCLLWQITFSDEPAPEVEPPLPDERLA